ncbi:hypothetical protein INT43_001579 [Umbelopsis isabellina]|uniref:Uncharacterized protein n=1 Tax=Mortierella isabellina TaxID=91625 RepID=A0A8H7U8J1_MORIS|nr:hypothetical protein INT43_001579 [Umbelopsis isabellina]
MTGRQPQPAKKLCQNIFDVHRLDLLNVLETLREAFYTPPEREIIKPTSTNDDQKTQETANQTPELVQAPEVVSLTPPAQTKLTSTISAIPSPLRATSTPPATPDTPQQASTPHMDKQPAPKAPAAGRPLVKTKAVPMLHVQRRLITLLKKEPSKYSEAEILRTLSMAFGGNSPYSRIDQRHLAGTLAVVARGMRKKKVLDKLIQARAGLDTN